MKGYNTSTVVQGRHLGNLNLANYQNVKLNNPTKLKNSSKKRLNMIQVHKNSKILEKNEGGEALSQSSYEESIEDSHQDILNQVSPFSNLQWKECQTVDVTKDSLINENTLSLEDMAILTQRSYLTNDSKFEIVHAGAASQEHSRSLEPARCSYSEIQQIINNSNGKNARFIITPKSCNCQSEY